MMELIHVCPDRPVTVRDQDGWRVYVSVHDEAHLREKSRWKALLMESHPDRGGSPAVFRRHSEAYQRWRESEVEWYASYGLQPPVSQGHRIPAVKSRPKCRRAALLLVLSDGQPHRTKDLQRLFSMTSIALAKMVYKARQRGYDIRTTFCGRGKQFYQLHMQMKEAV